MGRLRATHAFGVLAQGSPIGYPWVYSIQCSPACRPWIAHEFTVLTVPRVTHGPPMGLPRVGNGLTMRSLWATHGFRVLTYWSPMGFPWASWVTYGSLMGLLWASFLGTPLDTHSVPLKGALKYPYKYAHNVHRPRVTHDCAALAHGSPMILQLTTGPFIAYGSPMVRPRVAHVSCMLRVQPHGSHMGCPWAAWVAYGPPMTDLWVYSTGPRATLEPPMMGLPCVRSADPWVAHRSPVP